MRRSLYLCLSLGLVVLGGGVPGEARRKEDAVYVYDLFREPNDCASLIQRLRMLPLRPTVILSMEQGPRSEERRVGKECRL